MERQDLNGVRTPMDVQRRMKNKQVEENTTAIKKIIQEQIHVDSALSNSSENPVQNKVITEKFEEYTETSDLATVATTGDYSDLSNAPTSLADLSDDSTHRLVTDTEKSEWSSKQDELVSGTNIKTINTVSLLGSGDITVGGGGVSTDVQINGTSITSGGVANLITEGTYDPILNKLATMGDIIETGTNANGKYIKFAEGTMICLARKNLTFIATTQSGALYSGTVDLGATPATWYDTTLVRTFVQHVGLNNITTQVDSISTTSFGTLHFLRTTSTGSDGYGGYVDILAIGTWK